MMLSFGVPKSFWDDVIMTVYYLTNMTPSTALNGDRLYEKLYDKCANYSMLGISDYIFFLIKVRKN